MVGIKIEIEKNEESKEKWRKVSKEIREFGSFGLFYSDVWKSGKGVMRRRKFEFSISRKRDFEKVVDILEKVYGKVKWIDYRMKYGIKYKRCYSIVEFRVYDLIV